MTEETKARKKQATEDLIAQYSAGSGYTAKTDDELRTQAQNEVGSVYNNKRQSAQQQYDRNMLALDNQLASTATAYDRQRQETADAYAQNYEDLKNDLLARSMSRSSYGYQTMANQLNRANKAQADINEAQQLATSNINQQKSLYEQQYADTLKGYDDQEAADVANRMQALRDEDYNRGLAARDYDTQQKANLYDLMGKIGAEEDAAEAEEEAKRLAEEEAEAKRKAEEEALQKEIENQQKESSGGGSGSGSGTGTGTGTVAEQPAEQGNKYSGELNEQEIGQMATEMADVPLAYWDDIKAAGYPRPDKQTTVDENRVAFSIGSGMATGNYNPVLSASAAKNVYGENSAQAKAAEDALHRDMANYASEKYGSPIYGAAAYTKNEVKDALEDYAKESGLFEGLNKIKDENAGKNAGNAAVASGIAGASASQNTQTNGEMFQSSIKKPEQKVNVLNKPSTNLGIRLKAAL